MEGCLNVLMTKAFRYLFDWCPHVHEQRGVGMSQVMETDSPYARFLTNYFHFEVKEVSCEREKSLIGLVIIQLENVLTDKVENVLGNQYFSYALRCFGCHDVILPLYVCKVLVNVHGFFIEIEVIQGEGKKFTNTGTTVKQDSEHRF